MIGGHGDLRAALETTARQARELRSGALGLGEELLNTGGPFPKRLHLTERVVALYGEFLLLLIHWCDETSQEVETWSDTCDIGLTPHARERLEQLITRARHDR
jgi:PadR family transcriptional regulator, regulatory protein AphA